MQVSFKEALLHLQQAQLTRLISTVVSIRNDRTRDCKISKKSAKAIIVNILSSSKRIRLDVIEGIFDDRLKHYMDQHKRNAHQHMRNNAQWKLLVRERQATV